jgi:hypothetical protein
MRFGSVSYLFRRAVDVCGAVADAAGDLKLDAIEIRQTIHLVTLKNILVTLPDTDGY